MTRATLLVLAGITSFAMLGAAPSNQTSPPGNLIPLDWDIIQEALIWVDGVPLLPPYNVEIVGDSAVVVNSVPIQTYPTRSWQRPPKTASELLDERAGEAMFAAIRWGVPDSLIAAVGCSVFVAADTSLCLSAEVGHGGTAILVTARRHGRLYYDRHLVPSHDTLEAMKRPKPTTADLLADVRKGIDVLIARRSIQFFDHPGPHEGSVPRALERRLYPDIIAAASQHPFDEKKWQQDLSAGLHMLSIVSARKISEHTTWTER
jgi:hypothetical protein